MNIVTRLVLAVVLGVAVFFGVRHYDMSRGAEWEVSPEQIATAKAEGKVGFSTRPGSVAVLPIRSETADLLPYKWALIGLGAGAVVLLGVKRRKPATP